jgi:hypothetical protein
MQGTIIPMKTFLDSTTFNAANFAIESNGQLPAEKDLRKTRSFLL